MADIKQKRDTKDKSGKKRKRETDLDHDREEEIRIQEPKPEDVNTENNVHNDNDDSMQEEKDRRSRPKKRRFEEPIVTSIHDKVVPKWMKNPILIRYLFRVNLILKIYFDTLSRSIAGVFLIML